MQIFCISQQMEEEEMITEKWSEQMYNFTEINPM
jgi:hypothetical protein